MILKIIGSLLVALLVTGVLIRIFNPLPALEPRAASQALADTASTPLGRGLAPIAAAHPGLTGLHMLNDGRSAFAARVLLARAATRSLDIQYYIWHGDLSGSLLLAEVRAAAERGVRVRLLVDDNGIAGLDAPFAALDAHPNIEVRLYNPFVLRRPKPIGYLADFLRLNRRMHNKSFTADNQVTIIGGRNVGDEYFGARDEGLFADLDVMAVGTAVADVSRDFDRYWASQSAYPAARILPPVLPEGLAEIGDAAGRAARDPAAQAYVEAIRSLPFVEQAKAGTLDFEWAAVRLVSDDPAKTLGRGGRKGLLTTALGEIIGTPRRELGLVSGYFVPTQAGEDAFVQLAGDGVRVSILSNALEATDVGIVHAGYAHRRKSMLRAGVRLFEMRVPRGGEQAVASSRNLLGTGSGSAIGGSSGTVLRSSASTLHAKTFTVDRTWMFVGSFNFDPRSMHLNTELGFIVESPAMASRLQDSFEKSIPQRAYEVILNGDGDLVWIERNGAREFHHSTEPGTTFFQRASIAVLARLPIEWLL
jgi:putative cardiolipin synthase